MKNAFLSLLLAVSFFLCVCFGVSIGRKTVAPRMTISYELIPETTEALIRTDLRIDINAATQEQLMTLPGVGEVLAERIIAYRAISGPFKSVDDLILVDGIGTETLERMREHIIVGG